MSRCKHRDGARAFELVPDELELEVDALEDLGLPRDPLQESSEIPPGWWCCTDCGVLFNCEHPTRFLAVVNRESGAWLACRCGNTWSLTPNQKRLATEGYGIEELEGGGDESAA